MRLQRALARAGVASRRAAEKLIEEGKVRVDGKPAMLGMKVDPDRQRITVGRTSGQAAGAALARVPQAAGRRHHREGRGGPPHRAGLHSRLDAALTYVGRLDVMTTGLLLLTTDGEAVHRLTHPRYHIPRRYTALVHGRPTAEIAEAVQRADRDRRAAGGAVSEVKVRPGNDGRSILDLTLQEGRNRIVRRWCEAMGLKVDRLARLSYGPVRLGDLRPAAIGRSPPAKRRRCTRRSS